MNDPILPADDPRLTAYALGELTGPADLAPIEALLAASPEARAEVEEIRALSARLIAGYDAARSEGDGAAPLPANVIARPGAFRRVFPAVGWSLAAALAMLAVIAGLSGPGFPSAQVASAPREMAARGAVESREAKDSRALAYPTTPETHGVPALALAAPVPPAPPLLAAPLVADAAKVNPPAAAPLVAEALGGSRPMQAEGRASRTREVAGSKSLAGQPVLALAKRKEPAGAVDSYFPAPIPQAAAPAAPGEAPDLGRLDRAKINNGYEHRVENAFLAAAENPLSTFSADVDTASYANVRRFIEGGRLPPPDAVRVEEMLNYFPYSDAPPAVGDPRPFAIHLEAAACPWAPEHRLVRIGIKGREIATDQRPVSNLVFLVDVSGSMAPPERLPLIQESLRLMVEKLGENDRVGIVVYAGESGVALPSTSGEHRDVILAALGALHSGGSTNGAAGITLAYQIAQEHFIPGGVNRVILATDGDFNVGVTDRAELVRLIEKQARSGIFLSVLGVGTGNLQDATMQQLADRGNGNYAYLDSIAEGRKVLVEQMSGTLVTIAKDVKIQVEFNPAAVAAYRLIGYEKRALRNEDFNNDKIDAGEIGAGHSVTALYEIAPAGQPVPGPTPGVDALKYGPGGAVAKPMAAPAPAAGEGPRELLTVKMRHKAPDGDRSERAYEEALVDRGAPGEYANASGDFKFAAAVASFGLVLRESAYRGTATLGSARELAQEGKGPDANGYRAGFIELVGKAQALPGSPALHDGPVDR